MTTTVTKGDVLTLQDLVEQACGETGYLDPAAADWITPIIDANYNLGIDELARRVRGKITGTGDLFQAALTAKGRRRGEVQVAQVIVHRAIFSNSRIEKLADAAQFPTYVLRFTAVLDSCTCAAAKAMEGQIFRQAEAPIIPLQGCDAETCRCNYVFGEEAWLRRICGEPGG